jgi:hypothetical protein
MEDNPSGVSTLVSGLKPNAWIDLAAASTAASSSLWVGKEKKNNGDD